MSTVYSVTLILDLDPLDGFSVRITTRDSHGDVWTNDYRDLGDCTAIEELRADAHDVASSFVAQL